MTAPLDKKPESAQSGAAQKNLTGNTPPVPTSIPRMKIYALLFGLPMLATIPVAALFCRVQISRRKPIASGTLLAATLFVPLVIALLIALMDSDIGWIREHRLTPEDLVTLWGFMVASCGLSALGVMIYFKRREKKIPDDPGLAIK